MLKFEIRRRWIAMALAGFLGLNSHAAELQLKETLHPVADLDTNEPKPGQRPARQIEDGSMTIDEALTLATNDLANRLGHRDFSVTESAKVTWPDASAGCASPGYSYPQVLTPGYLIVFTDDNTVFRYTGSLRSAPKLCPASRFRPPFEANPDA